MTRNLFLLSFTANGEKLANRIIEKLYGDSQLIIHNKRIKKLENYIDSIFRKNHILVFIGAAGIAVRAVAPLLQNKMTDPAVIVIDEAGRYVIPLLSGHVGGANRFAEQIAALIGAIPVLTTATDVNGVFSIDTFAVEKDYIIVNPKMIKEISSQILQGHNVGLTSEFEITGQTPDHVKIKNKGRVGIYIGTKFNYKPFTRTLHLIPKCFHIGIGTMRNISFQKLNIFFQNILKEQNISVEWIGSLASIDLKQNEKAILDLANYYNIPFHTYSAEKLRQLENQFSCSEFVRSVTGIGNVCESSAYLASKCGEIVLGKTVNAGMTIAIAKESREICFDNCNK
ncbi:MAG: cobalt-precorrin 5A hydrolase [Planctomycetaceae bacterium]|jgi:cobalt-precorrin 5A hydrolase|nr:cobalt-precorrin 5A hydrolase [Planctomycetaceae bacterium]